MSYNNTYFQKWYSQFCILGHIQKPLTHDPSEAETPSETAMFDFKIAADLFSSPGNAH